MKSIIFALAASVMGQPIYNCDPYEAPPRPDNDISKLNPAHVELVMAMGDSISAAFAAKAGIQEDRDIAWSCGIGNKDYKTFPWYVSQYNPDVEGMSTKRAIPMNFTHLPHGDYHKKTDHLNFAESSGATHLGSMDEQWALMQGKRKEYPDFDTKWKVLTVWMTANDIMGKCKDDVNGTSYMKHQMEKYDELLTNITTTMGNVYVNFIATFDLSYVHKAEQTKAYCKNLHEYILHEGGCIDAKDVTDKELDMLDHNIHVFNQELHKMAQKWHEKLQADGRKDVAVQMQPF